MVPNVAGIIVKPIDFCYVTSMCIIGEPHAIYPCMWIKLPLSCTICSYSYLAILYIGKFSRCKILRNLAYLTNKFRKWPST